MKKMGEIKCKDCGIAIASANPKGATLEHRNEGYGYWHNIVRKP